MKNHYGKISKKPASLKEKEKKVMEKVISDIKDCNKELLKQNKLNYLAKIYNHVFSYLFYQTSFIYLKTNLSKILIRFYSILITN